MGDGVEAGAETKREWAAVLGEHSQEFVDAVMDLKGAGRVHEQLWRAHAEGPISEALGPMLAAMVSADQRGTVLDFGCGTGASSIVLLRHGFDRVVGVDVCDRSLAIARVRARDHGLDCAASFLHVEDTTSLPFPDCEFEVVLCNAVFEHIPPPSRPSHIREVWRVLKPGGVLMISETPNRWWPQEPHTTKLWLVPYMPLAMAISYAKLRGQLPVDQDTATVLGRGFRGMSWWELRRALPREEVILLNDRGGYDSASYFRRSRVRTAFHTLTRPFAALGVPPCALLPSLRLGLRKRAAP